jgi:hypothetical protein
MLLRRSLVCRERGCGLSEFTSPGTRRKIKGVPFGVLIVRIITDRKERPVMDSVA